MTWSVASPRLVTSDVPTHIAGKRWTAVGGFRVPLLPVRSLSVEQQSQFYKSTLRRFSTFLHSIHHPSTSVAIALQANAWPRGSGGARVDFSVLCRIVGESQPQAEATLVDMLDELRDTFPIEAQFGYSGLESLGEQELRSVLFQDTTGRLTIAEVQKYVEPSIIKSSNILPKYGFLPHPLLIDRDTDVWLTLVEILHRATTPTLLRISLEPYLLSEGTRGLIEQVLGKYLQIVQDGEQRSDLLRSLATLSQSQQGVDVAAAFARVQAIRAQGVGEAELAQARRGCSIYQHLSAHFSALWTYSILLSSQGSISSALLHSVPRLLCVPTDTSPSNLGWTPAEVTRISPHSNLHSVHNVKWMEQLSFGTRTQLEADNTLQEFARVLTSEEAAGLFHLPIFSEPGSTSAVSHSTSPFIIPSDLADTTMVIPGIEPSITLGYAYQRGKLLGPESTPFEVKLPRDALEKPALLVGAPGSGKTNLTLHILAQLWNQCDKTPFLVLEPSNGKEYRSLLTDPVLGKDLAVFTVGEKLQPFLFNPFQVPPLTTVRSHINRLLGCFRAAIDMWDPLPAIFQAALIRTYQAFGWEMDESGESNKLSPTVDDFSEILGERLHEILALYGENTEVAGNLRGASTLRISSIRESLGHIIQVREMPLDYFQNLLKKPTIIELGGIGDTDNIALMMAFLVAVLRGHMEYAYLSGARSINPHLLVIEEAHRLLSIEGVSVKPDQGNVRLKSAQDFNNMLSEVRKFRQGILVLDQRPSSLVGGVLDNTLVNLVCRLNDAEGFDRLSKVLNLSPAQQHYARTRMQPGDTLVLDRASGLPVMLRSYPYTDQLRVAVETAAIEAGTSPLEYLKGRVKSSVPPDLKLDPDYPFVEREVGSVTHNDCGRWGELLEAKSKGLDEPLLDRLFSAMYNDETTPIDWPEIQSLCHVLFSDYEQEHEIAYCFIKRWVQNGDPSENPFLNRVLEEFWESYS